MKEPSGVVLFYAIHQVFRLEKALAARGISTKPIPTPRHLSSDCGTALRFSLDVRSLVEEAIGEHDVEIAEICEM